MLFPSWVISGLGVFLLSVLYVEAELSGPIQPIGIDFGPERITAAYAHAADNVSILAVVSPGVQDVYRVHMAQLRQEFYEKNKVGDLYTSRFNIWATVAGLARSLVPDQVTSRLAFLESPVAQASTIISQTREIIKLSWRSVVSILPFVGTQEPNVITLGDIQGEFLKVLLEVKKQAIENHNINIDFALIAVPSFFNQTVAQLTIQASLEVGIDTPSDTINRFMMATFAPDNEHGSPNVRYLALEYCDLYMDAQTMELGTDKIRMKSTHLPMDPWGGNTINRDLAKKIVRHSESLQFELFLGENEDKLWEPIKKARRLIRNGHDPEIVSHGDDEDLHHDEYPLDLEDTLNLKDWGIEGVPVVLSWKSVQDAEKAYTDTLGNSLLTYLAFVRQPEDLGLLENNPTPQIIDKVLILTSGSDGHLVKKAVQRALGDEVEVVGDKLHEFALAAEGTARGALIRKKNQEKRQREMVWEHIEL